MKIKDLAYFAWQISRMHFQSNYRIPLSIYIVLTNRCNNRCIYCRTYQLPQKDIWTTNDLKKVMREMKSCGTRRIQLTGGEPMLRGDLGEIVAYAKRLGFFVGISTNGYQVAKRIDELKGADVVFLSYDGPPEVHARLRGEDNVKDVKSALSALKATGIRVWTTTVLTRLNASYVEQIVEFARKHHILANFTHIEYTADSELYLHPRIGEIKDFILSAEDRRKAFKRLLELKLKGAPIGSSVEYLKSVLEWPYDDKVRSNEKSRRYKCWAGRAWAHLDYDGKLYACGWGIAEKEKGINVIKKGFKSAWNEINILNNCNSCFGACGIENNLIFSLNLSAIWNAFKSLISE